MIDGKKISICSAMEHIGITKAPFYSMKKRHGLSNQETVDLYLKKYNK